MTTVKNILHRIKWGFKTFYYSLKGNTIIVFNKRISTDELENYDFKNSCYRYDPK